MIRRRGADGIRPYLQDASGMPGGSAEEVVLPETSAEVSEVLAGSYADGVPVTVSGGGTGLAGGRIPLGGSVLATDRLGGVHEVIPADGGGVLVAGPAATLRDLDAAAAQHGLFLPPDPTETLAWIGGAIATNASGARTFHYGPMRRWVRRLSLALPDGTFLDAPRGRFVAREGVLELPGRRGAHRIPVPADPPLRVKSATGYARGPEVDLVDLIVGSEGTLAVVTEIEMELLPRPEAVLTGVVFFRSEADCLAAVRAIRARSYAARGFPGPAPAAPAGAPTRTATSAVLLARALEFFGEDALDFIRRGGRKLPDGARAGLLFEQEHRTADEEGVVGAWLALLEGHHALLDDAWIAQDAEARRSIRDFRHALPEAVNEWLSRHGQRKHGTDIAVPDEAFPGLFDLYRRDVAAAHIHSATFGHVGDNHLHVNLLPRNGEEERTAWDLLRRWARRAVELGGVPSAEHGIGKLKAPLLAEVAAPAWLESMRATKASLDPGDILGRGTLLAAPGRE